MQSTLNKEDYLKKYANSTNKKKKKRSVPSGNVTIIDDDCMDVTKTKLNKYKVEYDDDEDKPQIAEVIDDRPVSVIDSDMWKPLSEVKSEVNTPETKMNFKLKNRKTSENVDHNESKYQQEAEKPDSSISNKNEDNDQSPPRKTSNTNKERDADLSPVRNNSSNRNYSKDQSPPRRKYHRQSNSGDAYEKRKYDAHHSFVKDDNSHRKRNKDKHHSSSRRNNETNRNEEKTDIAKSKHRKVQDYSNGKSAGLQSKADIINEINTLQRHENEMFSTLPESATGENRPTIVRSYRKSKQSNSEDDKVQQLDEQKKKEQYSRWGKGLTQVQDMEQRIQEDLYEMSKPLSRYVDDADLERHLKEQEREGDPMLEYIRKKRKKKNVEDNVPEKPQYKGSFMPNRYGIRPGYRWDGVDRSNGYEMKWIEKQNAKEALKEDTYKWSTEDM